MATGLEIVVDASVILAIVGNEPERPALIEMTRGARLVAPPSLHWEVGNALSSLLRRKLITLDKALTALADYARIEIDIVDVPLAESVDLAARVGAYAYDAYVIVCARQRRAPLATLDRSLASRAKLVGVDVLEVRR